MKGLFIIAAGFCIMVTASKAQTGSQVAADTVSLVKDVIWNPQEDSLSSQMKVGTGDNPAKAGKAEIQLNQKECKKPSDSEPAAEKDCGSDKN